jgi:hypothetical protein
VNGKAYCVVTSSATTRPRSTDYINAQNIVERVETLIDNAFLGDMPVEALYDEYRSEGGIQFPGHIVQRQGGYPTFDLKVTELKVNAPVTIDAPPAAPAAAAAAPATQPEKLGDGVYHRAATP